MVQVTHGGIASGYLSRSRLQALTDYCEARKTSRNKVVKQALEEFLSERGYLTGREEDRVVEPEAAPEKRRVQPNAVPAAVREQIISQYATGEHTYEALALRYGLAPATIGRFIRAHIGPQER